MAHWRDMKQCDDINSSIRQHLDSQRYVSVKLCLPSEIFLSQNQLSLVDLLNCELFFATYIYNIIVFYSLCSITGVFSPLP